MGGAFVRWGRAPPQEGVVCALTLSFHVEGVGLSYVISHKIEPHGLEVRMASKEVT